MTRLNGMPITSELQSTKRLRLSLLSARLAVTFPAAEQHRPLAGTRLYCSVTEAHRCEQLAEGCYAAFAPSRIWTHDLMITSPTLLLLRHSATHTLSYKCKITNRPLKWNDTQTSYRSFRKVKQITKIGLAKGLIAVLSVTPRGGECIRPLHALGRHIPCGRYVIVTGTYTPHSLKNTPFRWEDLDPI